MCNRLKQLISVCVLFLFAVLPAYPAATGHQDAEAIKVLESMNRYKDSLASFRIRGSVSADAQLQAGLIVANLSTVEVVVKQDESMHFRSEEGTERRQMFVHEGQLTVMATASGSYAQGEVPSGLTKALDYALDNYGVDLPLMDLARKDTLSQLVEPEDSVLYLGDTARVQGEVCHLVAIRTPEVDAQMWISKGDKPLPRRIVLTSKWAGGAPRFIAEMNWEVAPKIGSTEFEFKPPEGASRIEFLNAPGQ